MAPLRWPNRPLQFLPFLYPSLLFATKRHRWAACLGALGAAAAPAAPTAAFLHSCPTTCQAALTPWPGTKSPQRNRVSPSIVTDETLSQAQESWLLQDTAHSIAPLQGSLLVQDPKAPSILFLHAHPPPSGTSSLLGPHSNPLSSASPPFQIDCVFTPTLGPPWLPDSVLKNTSYPRVALHFSVHENHSGCHCQLQDQPQKELGKTSALPQTLLDSVSLTTQVHWDWQVGGARTQLGQSGREEDCRCTHLTSSKPWR